MNDYYILIVLFIFILTMNVYFAYNADLRLISLFYVFLLIFNFVALLFVPYSTKTVSKTIKLKDKLNYTTAYCNMFYDNNLAYVDEFGNIKNVKLSEDTKVSYRYGLENKIILKKEIQKSILTSYAVRKNNKIIKKVIVYQKIPEEKFNIESEENGK